MPNTLQSTMRQEMQEKEIFLRAQQLAFDYIDSLSERSVYPTPDALAGLDAFDEALPDTPANAMDVVEMLHAHGAPASVAQIGGRYFGFVTGGVIPAALAVRWLADVWDQNSALAVMSPVTAKLEEICERWLCDLFQLPDETAAGFVSGSSLAIVCGLAAARYRIFRNNDWDINGRGFYGAPQLRIVAGRDAHGAVLKAIALLGFGTDNIEWVETDDQGRIIPGAVPPLDARSILILQAGNVNTGAFDPMEDLCIQAEEAGAWVHVDGAFGLWAAASSELRHLTRGMETAHSFSVDGHKTLNTPYDSGIVLCRDRDALSHALQASGAYLAYAESRDGMLYTPEMSRRARAIELWAALKYLGKQGVDDLVTGLHARAAQFARELDAAGFRILNDVVFNQVLVACDTDQLTEQTMQNVQASGECWAGGSIWDGHPVIRISVCSWATTEEDVTRSVAAFVAARTLAERDSG